MTSLEMENRILELYSMGQAGSMREFKQIQHFLFGCVSHMRKSITFPVLQTAYEQMKPRLGQMGGHRYGWRPSDIRALSRCYAIDKMQYSCYSILRVLLGNTTVWNLGRASIDLFTRDCLFLSDEILTSIWQDTVEQVPSYPKVYPKEVQCLALEIRDSEKYEEIGILADMCIDFKLDEEATHFQDNRCLHTYACRYLHNLCRVK